MSGSIKFSWDPKDFDYLVESCRFDDAVKLSLKYLNDKSLKILEAGCGSGRVVNYLYDLGFQNIYGIELNHDAVTHINRIFPELNIIQGDLLYMPYDDKFDVVLSYGVVEHFPDGLELPLLSIYDILKPGGVAIVTVPSFNTLRKFGDFLGRLLTFTNPKRNNYIRMIFNRELLPKRNKEGFL